MGQRPIKTAKTFLGIVKKFRHEGHKQTTEDFGLYQVSTAAGQRVQFKAVLTVKNSRDSKATHPLKSLIFGCFQHSRAEGHRALARFHRECKAFSSTRHTLRPNNKGVPLGLLLKPGQNLPNTMRFRLDSNFGADAAAHHQHSYTQYAFCLLCIPVYTMSCGGGIRLFTTEVEAHDYLPKRGLYLLLMLGTIQKRERFLHSGAV